MIKWNYATKKKNRVLPWPMPFTSMWQLWSTLYVVVEKKNCMAHLQTPSALDNGVYIALYPKLKSSPSRYIKLNKLVANVQNLCSFIYTTCNFSSCMWQFDLHHAEFHAGEMLPSCSVYQWRIRVGSEEIQSTQWKTRADERACIKSGLVLRAFTLPIVHG